MRTFYLFLSLMALATFTASASAQSTNGHFQLGLSTGILEHQSSTTSNPDNDSDLEISGTDWGIGQAAVLELGYGVGDLVVLGALASINGGSQTISADELEEDQESSGTNIAIGPKIDVLFMPESTVRPFIGAAVGYSSSSRESASGSETTLSGVQLYGRAGLHWFASEGFSLAPSLLFGYASASGEVNNELDDTELETSGFSVALLVGFAGWIQ